MDSERMMKMNEQEHAEAFSLAYIKADTSNLARCYIDLVSIRAKDAERIAELEAALKENMYSNSTDIALKLGTEALSNKSDWLAKPVPLE